MPSPTDGLDGETGSACAEKAKTTVNTPPMATDANILHID